MISLYRLPTCMCVVDSSVRLQVPPWTWALRQLQPHQLPGAKSAGRLAVAASLPQASIWLNAHLLMQAQAGRVAVFPCLLIPCICQTLLEKGRLEAATLSTGIPELRIPDPRAVVKEAAAISTGRMLDLASLWPATATTT